MTDLNVRAELISAMPDNDTSTLAIAGFLAGYKPRTREGYRCDLAAWTRFCAAHGLGLFQAERAHANLWQRVIEQQWMPGTVAKRLSTVKTFYGYCVDEELTTRNPFSRIRPPRLDQDSRTASLDRNELIRFVMTAQRLGPKDHALACLLAYNGLRASECCSVMIQGLAVERGHRTLVVARKGGKRQTIPLIPRVARSLDLVIGERADGPILITGMGTAWDRMEVYRRVKKICRHAGLPAAIHPHSLRHSSITAALDAGVPLRDVQEFAAHADPRTTGRYDRNRVSLDRHASYILGPYLAGG